MTLVQFVSLLVFIAFTIVVISLGAKAVIRKVESGKTRRFLKRFYVLLTITFLAGGITRAIQQKTGIEWLNGVVTIFAGLFISLWGMPFLWRVNQDKLYGSKRILALLAGVFFLLLGLSLIYLGVNQILVNLH
jgi:hypothetical protein